MEEKLFKEIQELHSKFRDSWEDKKQFNVFTALRPISDEVYLHSRFIATILDPEGNHGLDKEPLNELLQIIGSNFHCGDSTSVRPNPREENWKEEKEIDILIEGLLNEDKEESAIIIENKIYAKDSNHPEKGKGQLQGYYHYVAKKGYNEEQIETYYLTPNRHEPSIYSLKGDGVTYPQLLIEKTRKDKHPRYKYVRLIDYGTEICNWIEKIFVITTKSILDSTTKHNLLETFVQYEQVVKKLVGDIKINEKLTQLVSDNFEEAKKNWNELRKNEYLGDKVKDIYWHCTADFFFQLEKALNKEDGVNVEIEQRPHPIHEDITYLIKGNPKNQTEKHALYYRVRNKEKKGYFWTIQASPQGFFFGLDNKQIDKTKGWKEIKYFDKQKDSYGSSLHLLNLWDFLDGDTLDLLNEEKRKNIAKQYAKFVKDELAKLN